MNVQVIGDEIHFDGYVVGMLAQAGVPATVMADLEEWLNNATLDPPADDAEPEPSSDPDPDAYDAALADVELAAKEYAKGGLLRLSDLAKIVAQLKEETP